MERPKTPKRSADLPVLTPGTRAESEQINLFLRSVAREVDDAFELLRKERDYADAVTALLAVEGAAATALAQAAQTAQEKSARCVVTFHTREHIIEEETTAQISTTFAQASLPIEHIDNNLWGGSKVTSFSVAGTDMTDTAKDMFSLLYRDERAWLVKFSKPATLPFTVSLSIDPNSREREANFIELIPLPTQATEFSSIKINGELLPSPAWKRGPVRLFFPRTQIGSLDIELKVTQATDGSAVFGLYHLRAGVVSFSASEANLVFEAVNTFTTEAFSAVPDIVADGPPYGISAEVIDPANIRVRVILRGAVDFSPLLRAVVLTRK